MSYSIGQCEKYPWRSPAGAKRWRKKVRMRMVRQRMRDPEYTPHFNRYSGYS